MITGGAGFLGYHLCNKLWKKFDEIVVVDINPIDEKEYPKNVKYHKIDITNLKNLEKLFKENKFNSIIHAAAGLPLYTKKAIRRINVVGTKNILDLALKYDVGRIVYVSSTAVYGVPEKHPILETDSLIGVGAYGKTKIIAERLCENYRKKGLHIPIVRPKTFIGTGRLGVFQILYDWVENGKRIPIIGFGKNCYQLLEVEDLVDSINLMLSKNKKLTNDTFNVGAEKFDSVFEDVSALCNHSKSGSRVLKTPAFPVKICLRFLEMMRLSPLYGWVYETAEKDSFVSIEKIQNICLIIKLRLMDCILQEFN